MAIAFGNETENETDSSTNSVTVAHTATAGSDRILFAGVRSGGVDISDVTYDGVSMTSINAITGGAGDRINLRVKTAPDTVSRNIVFTSTANAFQTCHVSSFTGAEQTETVDANATEDETNVQVHTPGVTIVANNSWMIAESREYGNGRTIQANTNSVIRSSTASQAIYDTNADQPTGAQTMDVDSFAGDATDDWVTCIASFAPAVAAVTFIPRVIHY